MVQEFLTVFLLAWPPSPCQDPKAADEIDRLVSLLRSEMPEARENGEQGLKALPSTEIDRIRRTSEGERDPETKARLLRVLKHLLLKQSEELFQAERLEASLRKKLEAAGVADIQAEYVRRLADAEKDVRPLLAPPGGPGSAVSIIDEEAPKVLKKHEHWALPALLEGLRGTYGTVASTNALHVFKSLSPTLATPVLRSALHSKGNSASFDDALCQVFFETRAKAELRKIVQDDHVTARAKETAAYFLKQLGE